MPSTTPTPTPTLGRSVLDQIGNTPLLRLERIGGEYPGIEILAKAEWFNPGGSVKDRPAWNMVRQAEIRGQLRPGLTLLDATSGNTGIALAMIGAARGYPVRLCLPANASPERKLILRAYHADLVLTDPAEATDGAIRRARELVAAEPGRYFYADQYSNPDNWRAHYETTGVEIWRDTGGAVTHFIAGLGTSGTFMGVSRRLRDYNPEVRCVSLQPDGPFHGLEGWKHMGSALVPAIYDPALADEDLAIGTEEAYAAVLRLAREEGILAGVSAGAALVGALRVAGQLRAAGRGGVIVTIFPDNADKYLSERFWTEAAGG